MKYNLSETVVLDLSDLIGSNVLEQSIKTYEREKTWKISFEIKSKIFGSLDEWVHKSNKDYIEFKRLVQKWKEDKQYVSSISDIINSPYYKQIIEKGDIYLNFIIDELKSEPDYWFDALTQITKKDPIKREHWGNLENMTKDWLDFLAQ